VRGSVVKKSAKTINLTTVNRKSAKLDTSRTCSMSVRPANFLLPEDMFPDFSAVAVTEDGANTALFSLSNVRTEYVVLVYLPTVRMVAELLALRDNLHKFTQVRQQ
jgi:hypothetical protein